MREKLAKLIDVKSIMTLALTGGFIGLTCVGEITGDQFLTIYTVIVGFYFGTQFNKKAPPGCGNIQGEIDVGCTGATYKCD